MYEKANDDTDFCQFGPDYFDRTSSDTLTHILMLIVFGFSFRYKIQRRSNL